MALVALLAASVPEPALAVGSPPVLASDVASITVDEDYLARVEGDWSDPDGDEVTLTTDLGTIDKLANGRWRWGYPATDGPFDAVATITATDDTAASSSLEIDLHVNNVAPYGTTTGPAFVPASSVSDRAFLWQIDDVAADVPDIDVDCGSGSVTAGGPSNVDTWNFLRCHFGTSGPMLVGPRATDKDGAFVDGRIPVVATTAVKSILDGRLVLTGPFGQQSMGGALAAVDLDVDGKADTAIGSSVPQWLTPADPGLIPVIRGRSDTASLNLGALPGGASWTITGPPDARFGSLLAAAGDVNGDGRGDLLIGSLAGAWVVYGKVGFTSLDVRTMAVDRGFEINGSVAFETGPQTLAGVGDVNSDGFADIAVGSPDADSGDGEVAVILGRANPTDIDVTAMPAGRGFTIAATASATGWSVAGGDVNGDGRSDVAVASHGGWNSNVLVIFGTASPADVDEATMTAAQGFTIGSAGGLAVAAVAVGDLDRDGFADVALAHNWGQLGGSAVTVVRGGVTNPSVPSLIEGPRVATIETSPEEAVKRLGATDLTDDGFVELIIGTAFGPSNGSQGGSAYVIRGGPTVPSMNLSALHPRWTRVDGDVSSAWAGAGLATGDVTGDGVPDLVVGADGSTTWAGDGGGRVAVFPGIPGTDATAPVATAPVHAPPGSGEIDGLIPIRVTWSASDTGTGIAQHQVHLRTDAGPWANVGSAGLATALTRSLAPGHDYRFRVRARDGAGNWSAWKYGESFRLRSFGNESTRVRYGGSWVLATHADWWGGTARSGNATGSSASITFTGRALVWVAAIGPDRGVVRIYVNGSLLRSVDLARSMSVDRGVVVFRKVWPIAKERTVRIVIQHTPGRHHVDLDGFIVLG